MDAAEFLLVAFVAAAGLVIGSFLNVVIYRVPRDESVVHPRSHCPACGSPVRPRDDVPVLSWLVLRGRCRDCGGQISARYPAVEMLTAALFALLTVRFGLDGPEGESWRVLPAFLYLGGVAVALAVIDLDTKRLPNKLTLPAYVVAPLLFGLATLLGAGVTPLVRAGLGLVAMYAVYLALLLAYPAGMGFGDVKLAGIVGLYLGWLGWDVWAIGLFAGFFAGGLVGVLLLALGRAGRKSKIPFGPFMIFGALLAVLLGEPIAKAWLGA